MYALLAGYGTCALLCWQLVPTGYLVVVAGHANNDISNCNEDLQFTAAAAAAAKPML